MRWSEVRSYLRDRQIDGWLIYDFRGSNPVLAHLLPGRRRTTRRAALFIPAAGEPLPLCHELDRSQFQEHAVASENYLSWSDFREWLSEKLAGHRRTAMEYAPAAPLRGGWLAAAARRSSPAGNPPPRRGLPVVSVVDAGTLELVRSLGVEVVSSADLIQLCVACWSDDAVETHLAVSRTVAEIKDAAFAFIAGKLRAGQPVSEQDAQRFILAEFEAAGLEYPDPPIVAVNEHSGDPHYGPPADAVCPIRRGDWVLIDLWARKPGRENVCSDVTWVGLAGPSPSEEQRAVFDAVRRARDAVVERAHAAWRTGERIQGCQLDRVARGVLSEAGFGQYIRHRTGRSLSPGEHVHGLGVNLDDFETHDTREMLPRLGFTVEPGLYLPRFGVRLDINVYVNPQRGPVVTCPVQNEIVRLE